MAPECDSLGLEPQTLPEMPPKRGKCEPHPLCSTVRRGRCGTSCFPRVPAFGGLAAKTEVPNGSTCFPSGAKCFQNDPKCFPSGPKRSQKGPKRCQKSRERSQSAPKCSQRVLPKAAHGDRSWGPLAKKAAAGGFLRSSSEASPSEALAKGLSKPSLCFGSRF